MNDFWNDIDWADTAQKVVIALLILLITWIVAKLVRWLVAKLTNRIPAMQRSGDDGDNLGSALGSVAALLVWLFGLVAILQVFGLNEVLAPIQSMLNGIMEFLPNLIGAVFVFVIGALLAKVVRQLIETALGALPLERWFSSASSRVSAETGTSAGSAPPQRSIPGLVVPTRPLPRRRPTATSAPRPSRHCPRRSPRSSTR